MADGAFAAAAGLLISCAVEEAACRRSAGGYGGAFASDLGPGFSFVSWFAGAEAAVEANQTENGHLHLCCPRPCEPHCFDDSHPKLASVIES